MDLRDIFISIYSNNIKREGADALLEFLESSKSDFFIAPASSKYHNSCEGGLLSHSINVYNCLKEYLSHDVTKQYGMEYSDETIAIVGLLHDICKINCYKVSYRNNKNEQGVWEKIPYYEFDDSLPYGHGEKSVYMISPYMKLTREEAFAIRYHMGFAGEDDKKTISKVFPQFPLAFALSVADQEASYFVETR